MVSAVEWAKYLHGVQVNVEEPLKQRGHGQEHHQSQADGKQQHKTGAPASSLIENHRGARNNHANGNDENLNII